MLGMILHAYIFLPDLHSIHILCSVRIAHYQMCICKPHSDVTLNMTQSRVADGAGPYNPVMCLISQFSKCVQRPKATKH